MLVLLARVLAQLPAQLAQPVEHAGTGLPGKVAVRDSKDREGPVLTVSGNAWSEFTDAIKHGEFDL